MRIEWITTPHFGGKIGEANRNGIRIFLQPIMAYEQMICIPNVPIYYRECWRKVMKKINEVFIHELIHHFSGIYPQKRYMFHTEYNDKSEMMIEEATKRLI